MPSSAYSDVVVITRAKHVTSLFIIWIIRRELPTAATTYTYTLGKISRVYQPFLHKFVMQFYSAMSAKITEVIRVFSPLSTPLIISPAWSYKENLLVRSGG